MHILIVHNRYRAAIPSGENAVVDNEIAALTEAGHQVTSYLRSSDELTSAGAWGKFRHVASPIHSRSAVRDIEELIRRDRPDVLHLHNPYPLISLSTVAAAKRHGIPTVHTVHNHRHTCMKGTYQREGRACHDCLTAGHPGPGVRHGCYRDSRPQSAVMAAALVRGRGAYQAIDRFVALTPEIAQSLADSGMDPARIRLKPNSVPDPGPTTPLGNGVAFVGRLSEEKGVLALLSAWARHPEGVLGTLRIAGDGPAAAAVQELAAGRRDIEVLGRLDSEGVHALLTRSALVVVPSLWPEAFPLVLLEAMAAGRPLLVTDQGGLPAVVDPEIGCVVDADVDGLSAGLLSMTADRDALAHQGALARARYEGTYHPRAVTEALVAIYADVLAERA